MPVSRHLAFPIACLLVLTGFAPAAAGEAKAAPGSIHIAIRPDGRSGSGSAADPFDGSTQARFDAALRRCGAGSDIVLGPGTFLTKGNDDGHAADGFFLQPNTRLRGSGRGVTVVKLAALNFAECVHVVIGTGAYGPKGAGRLVDFDNVTVEDLTVDANAAGLKLAAPNNNVATYGVQLSGDNATIRNVEVLHAYARSGPFESFALGIFAMTRSIDGGLIENCVVRDSVGDYVTAIILGGHRTFKCSGVVAHNLVVNNEWVAYSGGFSERCVFANNVANRVGYGFRFDSGDFTDVTMTGNVWNARHSAILLTPQIPNAIVGDLLITGNVLRAEQGPVIDFTSLNGTRVKGVLIRNNVLRASRDSARAIRLDPKCAGLYADLQAADNATALKSDLPLPPPEPSPSPATGN